MGNTFDKSASIFNNKVPEKIVKKAANSKKKFIKKYGDDSSVQYHLKLSDNPVLSEFNCKNLVLSDTSLEALPENPLIVGNIRMGFGHYRISMAIASCAKHLGYTPVWMDLNSFNETTCTKIISGQNDLYSMGSRLSQKFSLFNKLVWEPLNYEGFRQLKQCACDQKTAEAMTPVFTDIPKDVPFVATHVWPSQAAIHSGMTKVVNAIPDNWQMALHLSEGAIHTIQTHNSFWGYKTLRGMDKDRILNPMGSEDIIYTGHYVDHEMLEDLEGDCKRRIDRVKNGKPVRFLLTVGGAGGQKQMYIDLIKYLLPFVNENKCALFINVGDHKNVWDDLEAQIPALKSCPKHFSNYAEVKAFTEEIKEGDASGVHAFYDQDIFSAVYSTNLLMRVCDVLVTKPSELSFYPVPKLFNMRIGGHEKWGAIHSAEIGDGTYECSNLKEICNLANLFITDKTLIPKMCENIMINQKAGIYDGGYKVVESAAKGLKG